MKHLIAAAAFAIAAPVSAAVVQATPAGFEVSATVTVAASPAAAYAALGQPGRWWSSAHTYSGKAANLALDPKAGGCFCEALANGGSVEHARVVFASPGKALRLRGGLGPIQQEGADGALTWTLKPSGTGTEIGMTYVVGGFIRSGAQALAPAVDGVMVEQLTRLKAHLDGK